jgi:hypothetical protein
MKKWVFPTAIIVTVIICLVFLRLYSQIGFLNEEKKRAEEEITAKQIELDTALKEVKKQNNAKLYTEYTTIEELQEQRNRIMLPKNCKLDDCLLYTNSPDNIASQDPRIYGITTISGYFGTAEEVWYGDTKNTCDAFFVTKSPEYLRKFRFGSNDTEIFSLNIDLKELPLEKQNLLKQSSNDNTVSIIAFFPKLRDGGVPKCHSRIIILDVKK